MRSTRVSTPAFFRTIRTILRSPPESARDSFRSAHQLRPCTSLTIPPYESLDIPTNLVLGHGLSTMDQPGQYVQPPSHQRHQRFPSSQLPPPSQLLPGSSYSNRSITLPPINSLSQASSRYAPYPHHSSPVSSSHPSSQLPWQNQPIPREELVHRSPQVKQESHPHSHREPPESNSSQQVTSRHDPTEDSMSSTSDFVKKLYKYVPRSAHLGGSS